MRRRLSGCRSEGVTTGALEADTKFPSPKTTDTSAADAFRGPIQSLSDLRIKLWLRFTGFFFFVDISAFSAHFRAVGGELVHTCA
jgi:hypothetical protein